MDTAPTPPSAFPADALPPSQEQDWRRWRHAVVRDLAWVLASGEAYKNIYGLDAAAALVPFNQPALVTLPLSFAVLVGVSLLTRRNPMS